MKNTPEEIPDAPVVFGEHGKAGNASVAGSEQSRVHRNHGLGAADMGLAPHYILAKYVPEVMRNEPRNIGVIVWTQWGLYARFEGEEKGSLDQRKIPAWVRSKAAYAEWIGSWRSHLLNRKIRTPRGEVTAENAEFLEALVQTSKENYLLADTGTVLDAVSKEDCPALLEYLFSSLVDDEADKETAKLAFDIERECNKIIRKTPAFKNPDFHRDKSVMCRIAPGVIEQFDFNYYFGNGVPRGLYQRVPMASKRPDIPLNATAWQMEKVIQAGLIDRNRTGALLMPTEEQREEESYQKAVAVLKTQTRVFDVAADPESFAVELEQLAEAS